MFYNIKYRINTKVTPLSDPDLWGQQADWEIKRLSIGYLIKNVLFPEYLFAADDNLAQDANHRSVFTSKDLDSLAPEGIWGFEPDFAGAM